LRKLPEACARFLAEKDVYLVTEAFRVSKGSYELIDKNGAKVNLSAAIPGGSAGGNFGGSASASGTLTVAEKLYFGVRRAKQISPNSFTTLGTPPHTVPEADSLLRQIQP
jgi:hypothetical protein